MAPDRATRQSSPRTSTVRPPTSPAALSSSRSHTLGFTRLGEGLRDDLILPVLNSCTAETLWQLEEEDPVRLPIPSDSIAGADMSVQYIAEYTSGAGFLRSEYSSHSPRISIVPDIWRTLCHKQYPLLVLDPEESGSASWKEEFAVRLTLYIPNCT